MTKVISIIGGGYSFSHVDHHKVPGNILCVNDSFKYFQGKTDGILTMDRLWTEYRWVDIKNEGKPFYARRSALQNIRDWRERHWAHLFDNDNHSVTFSEDPAILNGTHSGACAINFAYQHRPEELYLFGFDMQRGPAGQPYWYPSYPWSQSGATKPRKYEMWAKEFDLIAKQLKLAGIKAYIVSDRSLIKSFEIIDTSKYMVRGALAS